jgi:uncharacterized membrane protein YedE/YeeE
MTIDWLHFTPWRSLGGGAFIGLAVAILVVANGRIAGISGILGGLLRPARNDWGWRLAFVVGLLAAPTVFALAAPLPVPRVEAGTAVLVIAGLLVGFGTRLGSGCTGGHGVRGLARMSPRSLAATLGFMAAGFATVFFVRHVLGAA